MLRRYALPLGLVAAAIAVALGAVLAAGGGDPVKQLQSSDPEERVAAVKRVAEQQPGKVRQALIPLIEDPDVSVACAVLRELGRRPKVEHLPVIRQAMHDERKEVREAAAVAMSEYDEDRADAGSLAGLLLQDQSTAVRAAAAAGLGRLRAWDRLEDLIRALDDVPEVAGAAAAAINQLCGVDFGYRTNDSAARRQQIKAKIIKFAPAFRGAPKPRGWRRKG